METKSKAVRVGAIGGLGGVALVGALVFTNPLGASAHSVDVSVPTFDRTGAALASAEEAYEQKVALEQFLEAKLAAVQAEVAQAKAALAAAQTAATTAPAPAVTTAADVDPHHCDGDHDGTSGFSAASYRGSWGDWGDGRHHRR